MFEVISNPVKRFTELINHPDWRRPLIIFLIITAAVALLTTYLYVLPNRESILEERNLTEEQVERARTYMDSPIAVISGPIAATVITLVRILSFTLFFYLTLSLLDARKRYTEILNVTVNSALIGIIGYAVKTPLLITTARPPTTGLAAFISGFDKGTFLFKFLDRIDFFAGWEVLVIIIGLSLLTRLDWKRLAVIIIPCWVLYNVVMATMGRPG